MKAFAYDQTFKKFFYLTITFTTLLLLNRLPLFFHIAFSDWAILPLEVFDLRFAYGLLFCFLSFAASFVYQYLFMLFL